MQDNYDLWHAKQHMKLGKGWESPTNSGLRGFEADLVNVAGGLVWVG